MSVDRTTERKERSEIEAPDERERGTPYHLLVQNPDDEKTPRNTEQPQQPDSEGDGQDNLQLNVVQQNVAEEDDELNLIPFISRYMIEGLIADGVTTSANGASLEAAAYASYALCIVTCILVYAAKCTVPAVIDGPSTPGITLLRHTGGPFGAFLALLFASIVNAHSLQPETVAKATAIGLGVSFLIAMLERPIVQGAQNCYASIFYRQADIGAVVPVANRPPAPAPDLRGLRQRSRTQGSSISTPDRTVTNSFGR